MADLLGLADATVVDDFIDALVGGDVLAGIRILDALEAEGRDLVAFSEQLVSRLREVLVERLSTPSPESRAGARPLTDAARRLTGVDASRSGLGGYRWQLELCLLAVADATAAGVASVAPPVVPPPPPASSPLPSTTAKPSPVRKPGPTPRAGSATGQPGGPARPNP